MPLSESRGFSIIEAVVALALFGIMLVGAHLTLAVFQDAERQAGTLNRQADLREVFLQDWANFSRRMDTFDSSGNRPSVSVLDPIQGSGFDFLSTDSGPSGTPPFERQTRDWQVRLQEQLNPKPERWVLAISQVSGSYRVLNLTIASGNTRSWVICCD